MAENAPSVDYPGQAPVSHIAVSGIELASFGVWRKGGYRELTTVQVADTTLGND